VASGTFAADLNEKEVTFLGKAGRFARFVALSEINGKPWTSMAEINILGTEPLAVESVSPNTMSAGSSVEIAIAGTGFMSGAVITFENGKGAAPEASNIAVTADMITAILTVASGGPSRNRGWDVRVTNPDGSSAVLSDGLTVTACCKKR
jgi:hypothetical protein